MPSKWRSQIPLVFDDEIKLQEGTIRYPHFSENRESRAILQLSFEYLSSSECEDTT